jgi:hypothetical protein
MNKLKLSRTPYWICVVALLAVKIGLLLAVEFSLVPLSAVSPIDTGIAVALAVVVGARFADVGWSRWLGFGLVVLVMFVLPVGLLLISPPTRPEPGASPLDALPNLMWISTVALLLVLVVAGVKRSSVLDSMPGVFGDDDGRPPGRIEPRF